MKQKTFETDEYKDLLREYRAKVKTASSRLAYLEQTGRTSGSTYKKGMRAAQAIGGKAKYFTSSNPKNMRVLRARMNAVNEFLESPGSTVGGIKAVDAQRAATISARYGLQITGNMLADVFNSAIWEKLDTDYGSQTAIKVLTSIQKTKGDVTRTLKSIGAKRLGLSAGERENVRSVIGEFVTPTDAELKEIRGFFKG